jgi:hypothetical protein
MPSVTRPRPWSGSQGGEWIVGVVGRCRDPDTILKYVDATAGAFERKAQAECDNVMRGVYQEMADAIRRGYKDAANRWRDVNG